MTRTLEIGVSYGRLAVVGPLFTVRNGSGSKVGMVVVQCECGKYAAAIASRVSHSRKNSACSLSCSTAFRNRKHGDCKRSKMTRLYHTWQNIIQRCTNQNNTRWDDYGGRGISVCPEWSDDFIVFRDWSMENGYTEESTIDRTDNDRGYSPLNCRWVPHQVQRVNQRRSDGTSKYIGVCYYAKRRQWLAQVRKGKIRKQKVCKTELEAAEWYDIEVVALHGPLATTNAARKTTNDDQPGD